MQKHVTKSSDLSFYPQNKQVKSKAIKPPTRRGLWCSYAGLDYLHQVLRFFMRKINLSIQNINTKILQT